jgi:hypothetical protein
MTDKTETHHSGRFSRDKVKIRQELQLVVASLAIAQRELGGNLCEENLNKCRDLMEKERELMVMFLFPVRLSYDEAFMCVMRGRKFYGECRPHD